MFCLSVCVSDSTSRLAERHLRNLYCFKFLCINAIAKWHLSKWRVQFQLFMSVTGGSHATGLYGLGSSKVVNYGLNPSLSCTPRSQRTSVLVSVTANDYKSNCKDALHAAKEWIDVGRVLIPMLDILPVRRIRCTVNFFAGNLYLMLIPHVETFTKLNVVWHKVTNMESFLIIDSFSTIYQTLGYLNHKILFFDDNNF